MLLLDSLVNNSLYTLNYENKIDISSYLTSGYTPNKNGIIIVDFYHDTQTSFMSVAQNGIRTPFGAPANGTGGGQVIVNKNAKVTFETYSYGLTGYTITFIPFK